jgi:hypothetical protein
MSLRAAIPPGTVPMDIDARAPIGKVENPAAAMFAALRKLESTEKGDHELAFRIVGATVKHSEVHDARRGLVYMMYHGIGTRSDPAGSVRAAMPLVRLADLAACEFAAATAPDTFKSATNATSVENLAKASPTQPIRLGGTITSLDGAIVTLDGSKQEFELNDTSDRMQIGRRLEMWGVLVDGQFRTLLNEVPEPKASFKWKVNGQAVYGGRWQVQDVRVTVTNSGVQPIKLVRFNVRCYSSTISDGDHSRTAEVMDIAPGKSKSVDVSFESYHYYYRAVSVPKASVDVRDVEW